jgi:hypothetical protein
MSAQPTGAAFLAARTAESRGAAVKTVAGTPKLAIRAGYRHSSNLHVGQLHSIVRVALVPGLIVHSKARSTSWQYDLAAFISRAGRILGRIGPRAGPSRRNNRSSLCQLKLALTELSRNSAAPAGVYHRRETAVVVVVHTRAVAAAGANVVAVAGASAAAAAAAGVSAVAAAVPRSRWAVVVGQTCARRETVAEGTEPP